MKWIIAIVLACVIHTTADAGMSRVGQRKTMDKETCQKLAKAFADYDQYGKAAVNQGARDRGVTTAQINQARAGCK